MDNESEITQQQALEFIQKWMSENRVMHLTIKGGNAVAKISGRIDAVKNGKVHFSAKKTTFPLGQHYSAEFSLENCTFEYSDAKAAPDRLGTALGIYDTLLYIYHFDSAMTLRMEINLAVLPVQEWSQF